MTTSPFTDGAGAEVNNILRFESDFPGAQIIRLEENYRSTPHILKAASAVIAANKARLGKTLWTKETQGQPLILHTVLDEKEEARNRRRRDRVFTQTRTQAL